MTRPRPAARVAVDAAAGHARLTDLSQSSYLRPRLLGTLGTHARVALVGACAALLAGDDLRLDVDVGPHTHLELVEPSGTVAYDARGGHATWTAHLHVAGGGSLVWPGAPFVVAHGADVHRHTDITLDADATLLLRETLVLGRSGEDGGRLRATLTATHAGDPLLVEDLDLTDPRLRSAPGILGNGRVLATTTLLGTRPDTPTRDHETQLAGPGALRREITTHAHLADTALTDTWTRWAAAVR